MSAQKPFKKIIVFVSAFAFLGSTVFMLGSLFTEAQQSPEESAEVESASAEEQLQQQAEGFERVLEREPNNQFALQGFVETKLQMNQGEEALAKVEKILQENPENQVALQALVQIHLQQENPQEAVAPLEKLIELNPEEEQLKSLLAMVKAQEEGEEVPVETKE